MAKKKCVCDKEPFISKELKDRFFSFLWRAGVFTSVSVCGYLANIADVQSIEPKKLATLFIVAVATFVGNEVTKYANTQAE